MATEVLSPQQEKLCERLKRRSESEESVPMLDLSELCRPEGKPKENFRVYSTDFVSVDTFFLSHFFIFAKDENPSKN